MNEKLSALAVAGAFSGSDLLYVVQSGESLQTAFSALQTGILDLPVTTGLTVGTIQQNGAPLFHTFRASGPTSCLWGLGAGNFLFTGNQIYDAVVIGGASQLGNGAPFALMTGAASLQAATVFGNGNLGSIGAASSNSQICVVGNDNMPLCPSTTDAIVFGVGNLSNYVGTADSFNYIFGHNCMKSATTATNNYVFADNGLQNATTGAGNVAMGDNVLGALSGTNQSDNVAIGFAAGRRIHSAQNACFIGPNSGLNNSLSTNDASGTVCIGAFTMRNGAQPFCVYIGYGAGYNQTSATGYQYIVSANQQTSSANDLAYSLLVGNFAQTPGTLTGQNLTVNGQFKVNGLAVDSIYTVSTLPTGAAGARAFVSDATVNTYGVAPIGGGTTFAPVYFDGNASAWITG